MCQKDRVGFELRQTNQARREIKFGTQYPEAAANYELQVGFARRFVSVKVKIRLRPWITEFWLITFWSI